MNYAKITYPDLNNGTGCRVSLWVTGCSLHCKGCFNSEIWNPNSGKRFTREVKDAIYDILSLPYIEGLSILGGEPLDNDEELSEFLKCVKTHFPYKSIWLWSGYTLDQLQEKGKTKCLEYIDVLVDGPFVQEEADPILKFRGSKNQCIWKKANNQWVLSE